MAIWWHFRENPLSKPPPDMGFLDAFLTGTLLQLTIFPLFVVLMALVLWRSGVWERRVIREELEDEIGRAVTPSEYTEIVGDGLLRTRRIDRMHTPQLSGASQRSTRARVSEASRAQRTQRPRHRSSGRRLAGRYPPLARSGVVWSRV